MNYFKCFFLAISFLTIQTANSQVVNAYARVTNIVGAVFSVTNVDETGHTFEDGEWVVVMQMQDDVIGGTGNNAAFGDLGTIESAGLYEIRQIASHTESAGLPNEITLENTPTNTYNTGANMRVQLITLREFGSPDYTTTADMSALAWDGNVGGVLAVYVPGILTLDHNLSADNAGFRGGDTNLGGSTGCTPTGAYRVIEQDNHANKGEGIFRSTNTNQVAGRGKILTGGGGGNSHNAGGGGGGNYSAGGLGGPGWNNCNPTAGGLGGISLSGEISVNRIFMGGGGGAGEGNNSYATEGADGGGIILLKAQEITTTVCAGVSISANGASILIAPGNDGGGGGGAAGSIVFEVDTWNIGGGCPLTISANGGDGGAVGNAGTHGGGGGGAQGVIFFSSDEPTTNVTIENAPGDGGCNNNSDPCNSRADSGGGADGDGIFDILTGPLPIELLSFDADLLQNGNVELTWITKSERNNDYFTVERSADALNWESISQVDGAGNSSVTLIYKYEDFHSLKGLSYYRLKQTDFDGEFTYSHVEAILRNESNIHIYPNPTNNTIAIQYKDINNAEISIVDGLGRRLTPQLISSSENISEFDVSRFPSGVYYVVLTSNGSAEKLRFVVAH